MSARRAATRREARAKVLVDYKDALHEYVTFAGAMGDDYDPMARAMNADPDACFIPPDGCYDSEGYSLFSIHASGCDGDMMGPDGLTAANLIDPSLCECGGDSMRFADMVFATYHGFIPKTMGFTCGNRLCGQVHHLISMDPVPV